MRLIWRGMRTAKTCYSFSTLHTNDCADQPGHVTTPFEHLTFAREVLTHDASSSVPEGTTELGLRSLRPGSRLIGVGISLI